MKKIASVIVGLACSFPAAPGMAQTDSSMPLEMPADSRMKILMYNDEDIYTITTKFGYQTNIVFDKNEEIQTLSVGDRSMWQLVPSGNRLFIRPMEEGAATNMTLITNKHSYQFDLKSVGPEKAPVPEIMPEEETDKTPNANKGPGKGPAKKAPPKVVNIASETSSPKDSDVIYVAKFVYPEKHHDYSAAVSAPAMPVEEAPAKPVALTHAIPEPPPPSMPAPVAAPAPAPAEMPAPVAETVRRAPANPVHKNDDYSYSGEDNLAPLEVFDNGESTFIKFRDMTQPLPDPYVVDAHGLEKPVLYYVQDNMMVIDRVVGELELKSQSGNVSVYNELLDPR